MYCKDIADVIPEKNIICVSPHYDDFLFFLGGYVYELKKRGLLGTKRFTVINVFSRSNYQERDAEGNKDQSLERVKYATGIRVVEDMEGLNDLLTPYNYIYRLMGEEESQVRGKVLNEGDGEMEMAFGSLETMDKKDHEICDRMVKCLAEYAFKADTAIVLPMAMKGHIDHYIAHRAGEIVMQLPNVLASFYFAEDKPYAGLLTDEEAKPPREFIEKYSLEDIAYPHHPEEVLKCAFTHYKSQVDDVYNVGICTRSAQLKELYKADADVDRIFAYKK